MFGHALSVYAMRSKYNLTYVSYGLDCGIRDPKLLIDYGKKFLRFWQNTCATLMELQNEGKSSVATLES